MLADSLSSMSWEGKCALHESMDDILQGTGITFFPRSWLDSAFLERLFVSLALVPRQICVPSENSPYSDSLEILFKFFLKTYIYASSQDIFEHLARTSQQRAVPPPSAMPSLALRDKALHSLHNGALVKPNLFSSSVEFSKLKLSSVF